MAAKYYHPNVLDSGLNYIPARVTASKALRVHLLKAYTQGDTYATCVTNSVGSNSVDLVAGDFALAAQGTLGRKLTIATKGVLVGSNTGASPDLHVAILNTTDSEVLAVTDETTNEVLVTGDVRQIPAIVLNMNQPT
jgi:hypothetical protein